MRKAAVFLAFAAAVTALPVRAGAQYDAGGYACDVVYVRVDEDADWAVAVMEGLPFVTKVERQNETIIPHVQGGFNDAWKISSALTERKFKLSYIERESESLERACIALTEGAVQ